MADYIIETEFQGPGFVAVPNHVAQGTLGAEALGVLVYLASQPRGFMARVSIIRQRFAIGKDRWQRIARELREAGAMDVRTIRGAGGRALGRQVVVRWPETPAPTESRETRPSDRKPEKPTVGKSAKQGRKIRQTGPENPAPYKDKEKQTEPAALFEFELSEVTKLQRSKILSGQSCIIGGRLIKPGTPQSEAIRAAIREHEDAEKGGAA